MNTIFSAAAIVLGMASFSRASTFTVNNSTFVITGSSVGIRTSAPAVALDVNGAAQFGQDATKSTFTAAGALTLAAGASLTQSGAGGFVSNSSSMTASAFFGDGSHLSGIILSGGSAGGDLGSTYPNPTVVQSSNANGFTTSGQTTVVSTLTVIGNKFSIGASSFVVVGSSVGIRTTTPATALDVNGSAQFGQNATKSTFTVSGALILASGASLTQTGAGGYITNSSSVVASAFFGDGSHLAGISGLLSGGVANTVPVWVDATTLGVGSGYITSISSGVNISTDVTFSGGVNIASQTYVYLPEQDILMSGGALGPAVTGSTVTLSSWSGSGPAVIEYHLTAENYSNTGVCWTSVLMDNAGMDVYTTTSPWTANSTNSGTPAIHSINVYYVSDKPIPKGTHTFFISATGTGATVCHINCNPNASSGGFGAGTRCKFKVREYP